jgi:hypothetical protein
MEDCRIVKSHSIRVMSDRRLSIRDWAAISINEGVAWEGKAVSAWPDAGMRSGALIASSSALGPEAKNTDPMITAKEVIPPENFVLRLDMLDGIFFTMDL